MRNTSSCPSTESTGATNSASIVKSSSPLAGGNPGMKPNRTYLTLSALLGLLLASFGANAAPEAKMSDLSQACMGTEAPKTLSECPGGPSTFSGDVKKHGAAFKSAP